MSRIIGVLFFLLVAILSAVFALINGQKVQLNYYFGEVALPLSIIMALTLLVGVLIGIAASLGRVVRIKMENARLKRSVSNSRKEIENLRSIPLKEIS